MMSLAPGYSLAIMTPEGRCFDGTVESLVAPGLLGSFGVLADHAPMVAALRPGVVRIVEDEQQASFFVISGGVIDINANTVTLLADTAEKAATAAEAGRKLDTILSLQPTLSHAK